MTAKKVLIGGFGSSKYQVNWMAARMSGYFDEEVVGETFVDAMRDPDAIASRIAQREVFTHSAGMLALNRVLWREPASKPIDVIAIAPPIPTRAIKLAVGALGITRTLMTDTLIYKGSRKSNSLHAAYMAGEIGRHLKHHVGVIPAISQFDSFEAARQQQAQNIQTQIIMMNNDEFFYADYRQLVSAQENSVDVRYIKGEHSDFINRPTHVMELIDTENRLRPRDLNTTSKYVQQSPEPVVHQKPAV